MRGSSYAWLGSLGVMMVLGFSNGACSGGSGEQVGEESWTRERRDMVEVLRLYQVRDEHLLAAMGKVRRHLFIPARFRRYPDAYGDHPCPIGFDQTISQPFIVAYMTEKLALKPGEKVLEIGTGSGYQAAVLAEMGMQVYSVEIVPELARHAREVLAAEGYSNRVQVLTGDGYQGWGEHAPYDAIIVTCAPNEIPRKLVEQLKEDGRFILPVGEWLSQRLVMLRKTASGVEVTDDLPVRFVPMIKGR